MSSTNYFDTFIAVAEDCPATSGEVPPHKEPKSVAGIEYEMVIDHPYEFTSDDVLYKANGKRRGQTRDEFFSRGQACFRGSPLTKRYGWGVHSDAGGKVALYAVGSKQYEEMSHDTSLKQLRALRSKRK